MVGMPYPNPSDPELVERMKSLDTQDRAAGAASQPGAPSSGRTFYEDLCMKVSAFVDGAADAPSPLFPPPLLVALP